MVGEGAERAPREVITMPNPPAAAEAAAAAQAALDALPWAYADQARRIYNITAVLLDAIRYDMITAAAFTDEGIYGLLELADDCTRVARLIADATRPPGPARAFVRVGEQRHREQCTDPRCQFTAHAAPAGR